LRLSCAWGFLSARLHPRSSSARSHFRAADARLLRASLSAFLDLLALAARTLEAFPRLAPAP
jgi:tRNA threonylcarbamoyladenosine modification (KEOPS) complex  Pcc1 subunit